MNSRAASSRAGDSEDARAGSRVRVMAVATLLVASWVTSSPPGTRHVEPNVAGQPSVRCGVWSSEPSPSPGDVENDLYGVSAISADDVWAVGYSVSSRQPERPLIEHRDTGTWTVAVTPDPGGGDAELVAVSGTSPGDVWAVGVRQGPTGPEALIEHWNGTTWSLVAAPTVGLGCRLAGG